MVDEVAGLQGVREGHPGQVPEHQHEAKPVMDDVHGGENGLLEPECVKDVDKLEEADEDHRVADNPVSLVLLDEHAVVDDDPANQPGTHLTEHLPVQQVGPGVEFPPHEPIVDDIVAVPPERQEGPTPEGPSIEVAGQQQGEDGGGRGKSEVVVVDKSDWNSKDAIANDKENVRKCKGIETINLVRKSRAVS